VNSGNAGARATLDAWRERGADRVDPVRFRLLEALERRSADYRGAARRILDDRLAELMNAYADAVASAASDAGGGGVVAAAEPARGALAELLDYLAHHARPESGAPTDRAMPRPSSSPDLDTLDYFRETWSKVSTRKRLRQSQHEVPKNAGPLNSSSLVHRSLSLMRELSPGYLQQFLSYVDALSWIEQINGGGAMAAKDEPRAGSARKGARGKPR
jgi:hypothetical protein